MMSLGTWKARSTKYQKFLNLSHVILLIFSTIIVFTAVVLIKFYHISKLDFWSTWFYINPTLMIVLGLYTFAVSVYGFLISNNEQRFLISLTAVFLSLAFLAQIFSVFSAMELRNIIKTEVIDPGAIRDEMKFYGVEGHEDITDKWDEMQRQLRCCGGERFDNGYTDWRSVGLGYKDSKAVPDSCCHEEKEGCGREKSTVRVGDTSAGIYKDGCLAILKIKLKDEVEPLMIVYACVGVLMAIVELITVVLACAYVAQINRRRRREEMFSRAGTAAHDEEFLPSLTSKETNF